MRKGFLLGLLFIEFCLVDGASAMLRRGVAEFHETVKKGLQTRSYAQKRSSQLPVDPALNVDPVHQKIMKQLAELEKIAKEGYHSKNVTRDFSADQIRDFERGLGRLYAYKLYVEEQEIKYQKESEKKKIPDESSSSSNKESSKNLSHAACGLIHE